MPAATNRPWSASQRAAIAEYVPMGYTRSQALTLGFLEWYEWNVEAGQGLGTVIDFYCDCRTCGESHTFHTVDTCRWWLQDHVGHNTRIVKARGVNPYDKPRVYSV